ncbi:TetR family transcriptional regulator [Streptomyces caniscabiei]|uniref:TetR family transcriptional regulator n=1 Tax=Streptomyces caniscabiei TaxID=2746961 RepID=UPI0029A6EAF5|nr:TetR family transcriptional regulator [Streptomyces caniscabiei]MDX2600352.1 TetR family transcriptional regulator [Streptomyces caniscabiei]
MTSRNDWPDDRRAMVARATWAVIEREGLEQTSLRKIADEAGCSTGVLTHYFRDKRELMRFAFDQAVASVANRLDRAADEATSASVLQTALEATLPLDRTRDMETVVYMSFLANSLQHEGTAGYFRDRYHDWRRLIAEHLRTAAEERGTLPVPQTVPLAELLLAFQDGLFLRTARQSTDNQATLEAMAYLVDRLLAPSAAPAPSLLTPSSKDPVPLPARHATDDAASAPDRRQVLTEATREVVHRSGLAGATLREIARAAGCTTGTIRHHFDGRQDLLAQTVLESCAPALRRLERTPPPALQAVAVALLDPARGLDFHLLLALHLGEPEEGPVRKALAELDDRLRGIIIAALSPAAAGPSVDAATATIIGLGLHQEIAPEDPVRAAALPLLQALEAATSGLV